MTDSSSLPSLSPLSGLGRLDLPPGSPPVGLSFPPRLPGPAAPRPAVAPGPPHLSGCVPLTHQVAGHKYGVDKVGILQHPDGTVLKQLQPPPRGPREMQFYRMVYAEDCCDPCLLDLQKHLPKYYGTWSSPENPHDLYLKLEDVTRRFVKPCIMDVKLGQRSYDPFASQEKREQQIRKYPLMEEVGFLVLGMRVYKVGSDTFDSYDQHYGRSLVKDTIKDGLAQFFHNGVLLRRDAVWASVQRVQQILAWFQSQRQLAFYASSLLFVYEGLPPSIFSSSFSSLLCSSRPSKTSEEVKGGAAEEEEEGLEKQEEEKEYNNNSIQLAPPWAFSLSSVYGRYRKDSGLRGGAATLRGGGATQLVAEDGSVPEEDNKSWSRTGEQTPNGNKSQLGGEEEERRKNHSSRKEEEQEEVKGPEEGGGSAVEVRMIDFAHVFPSESLDEGYIYGLKRLLLLLQQILCDSN